MSPLFAEMTESLSPNSLATMQSTFCTHLYADFFPLHFDSSQIVWICVSIFTFSSLCSIRFSVKAFFYIFSKEGH